MRRNNRVRRLLAGLMLFIMVSSVVADCNMVTAFAVNNESNISESGIVLETENHPEDKSTQADTGSNQDKSTQADTDSNQDN